MQETGGDELEAVSDAAPVAASALLGPHLTWHLLSSRSHIAGALTLGHVAAARGGQPINTHPRWSPHPPTSILQRMSSRRRPMFFTADSSCRIAPPLQQVKNYFNTTGYERWRKIYGETEDVNKVQLDIRTGHAQTVDKVLRWVDEEGGVKGVTVADCGCGTGEWARVWGLVLGKQPWQGPTGVSLGLVLEQLTLELTLEQLT